MKPSPRLRLSYGIGSIGTGIFTTVPSVLLLYFLTVEVHIEAALAGIVILIPKLLGVVGDPVIGTWSDRLQTRTQSGRQILMFVGAVLASTGLWALFAIPPAHPGSVLIAAAIFFVCTTGYSLFAVPYSALPAELASTERGRGMLVSTRLGISFLGVLIGGVTAPMVAGRIGYPAMGAMMGIVCAGAMSAFMLSCPLPSLLPTRSPTNSLAREVAPSPRGEFAIKIAAFVALLAAAGTGSALLPFLIRDLKVSTDVVGYAIFVSIVVALLTSMLWPALIRIFGLRSVWVIAAACQGLGAVTLGTAGHVGLQFYLGMGIGGLALSGVQIAGFTGLADLAARNLESGRSTGFVTGIWMAGEKAGLASGPLFAGFGLKFLGAVAAGSAARTSLTIIPAALALIAIAIILIDPTRNEAGRKDEIK